MEFYKVIEVFEMETKDSHNMPIVIPEHKEFEERLLVDDEMWFDDMKWSVEGTWIN